MNGSELESQRRKTFGGGGIIIVFFFFFKYIFKIHFFHGVLRVFEMFFTFFLKQGFVWFCVFFDVWVRRLKTGYTQHLGRE